MHTRSTKSLFGPLLILLALHLLIPPPTHAGGRRRVSAVSPPSMGIALVFVGSGPVVDAGPIAWGGGSKRSTATTRTVSLRIGEPSRDFRGTATVRAYLETVDPRCTIRIDGVTLTTAPRVVRRHAPIGITFSHRIEIDVPVTAADGPLQTSIGWEVTTD